MHFNFAFTAVQVLWTLTFAAQLVLLVVLLGRDRASRFPWFTAATALVALRLMSTRLLFGRLPQLTMNRIFLGLADISAIVGLLVLVELARRAFGRAPRRLWLVWILVLLAVGGVVVAAWGKWPAWRTITPGTPMGMLAAMQLFAQKASLLVNVLTIALGLLIVLLGRRYNADWRSHAQRIAIGLSTASIAQLGVQAIWEAIANHTTPHSMDEYQHVLDLRDKLFNCNNAVYIAAAIWWIACLWIDEPGTKPAGTEMPQNGISSAAELPRSSE